MTQANWKLLEVEPLAASNPDFFVYPQLSLEQRRAAQLGETVKVAASIEIRGEWKTRGIWLRVEESSLAPEVYVGRPHPSYLLRFGPDSDCTFEFGPQHIYRMEPRAYTVWARDGEPFVVWGTRSRPERSDGTPIENLEPLCNIAPVNGYRQMQNAYKQLATRNGWPAFDELQDRLSAELG